MERQHIDISKDMDGEPVIYVVFDLREDELAASARAVSAVVAERYGGQSLSADEVLELREFTALADELGDGSSGPRTVVLSVDRVCAYHDAVAGFVHARGEADWIREEDSGPLSLLRELVDPLEELCAEGTRAGASAAPRPS